MRKSAITILAFLFLWISTSFAWALDIFGSCAHGLFGNIYSRGVDTFVSKVNRATPTGVHFEVWGGNDPRFGESKKTPELIARAKRGSMIMVCGHSLGGDWVTRFVNEAKRQAVTITLAIVFDATDWDNNGNGMGTYIIPDNVLHLINWRQNIFPGGGRVKAAEGNTVTKIYEETLSTSHVGVPQSVHAQDASLAAILSIVHREQGL